MKDDNRAKNEAEAAAARRVAALARYDILDTDRERAFDDVVRLLAQTFDAPMAVVNLVADDRQFFKAETGLGVRETPLETSFCAHAILEQDRMVVPDARDDARFACNPLVTDAPGLRFYAGRVLKSAEGVAIGTLCILDTEPRPEGATELQMLTLDVLADQVMAQMELRRTIKERAESDARAARALEASTYVGAWDWDILADRVVADDQFALMYGVPVEEARRGAPIRRFLDAFHHDDVERVTGEIDEALRGRGLFESEYRLHREGGAIGWVLARGQVVADADGRPIRFSGVAIDISQRKEAELELAETLKALAESEKKFRAIADSMPQMVWSTLPDGLHDYYNARWYEFTGVPEGSTDGEGWNDVFHPEDQERAWATWRHSLDTGDPYEIEYRLKHHSGVYRWTLGRANPIRDEQGRITRWFGTCTDIDELKRAEQARELLSQELSHRIKNIFAVVSALIALSARHHPEARPFAQALRTRIAALASAHEFVRPHTDRSRPTLGSLTLHGFLADLFRPYADEDGVSRVIVAGEDADFDDQAATSVALLFHELATNAAKYGALSVDEGRVRLDTQRRGDRFILSWTEEGGPPPPLEPRRRGFGSSLAEASVEGQLGGTLTRDWRPEGLRVVAHLPETALSRRRAAARRK
ncbi:PAS domain-containing protein [Brevundimonas lutea]|uniref:PAS domain-containing protein n=1 Tax=Brevundimonas lutea TaxID=2293980 RepID=UPI000F02FCAA|nr:PAS domain-containing protein [Brevundimonas lutea]